MHEFNSLDYTPNLSVGVRVCCCWCLAYPNDKEKAFCWGHKIFKIKKKEEEISFWLALVFSHIFPYELLTLSLTSPSYCVEREQEGGRENPTKFVLSYHRIYVQETTYQSVVPWIWRFSKKDHTDLGAPTSCEGSSGRETLLQREIFQIIE